MSGITYDAGALIAAERGSRSMWALHLFALQCKERLTVPAGVLGQVWRGGPQAQLSRFLRGCNVEPLTESDARAAGEALSKSGTSDLIDAVVVVTALARGDLVVTSDPDDLTRIAAAMGRSLEVHAI